MHNDGDKLFASPLKTLMARATLPSVHLYLGVQLTAKFASSSPEHMT